MRQITSYIILMILLLWKAEGFAQADTSSLHSLLERVNDHPELGMKRAEIDAAMARISERSSLENPKLLLGVQNLPTDLKFDEEPMTAKVIGASQMFPFPGKLSSERRAAEYGVASSRSLLDEQRNMLRRDIKTSYYEILHRTKLVEVNTEHLKLLNDLQKEITANIAYAKAPVTSTTQIELERAELQRMIAEDNSMIAMQQARLLYLTGDTIIILSKSDSLSLSFATFSLDSLFDIATRKRPMLISIHAQAEQARAGSDRASLERYPDFDVMLMYMQRDDLHVAPVAPMPQMNMLTAQVAITLPINYNGKNDAMIAEMEAMRSMRLSEAEQMKREIKMMLAEKLARLEQLRKTYEIITVSSIPVLSFGLKSYRSQYQFDRTSLQSVVTQEIELLHKQHDRLEAQSEYYKTIAEVEFIIGADLLSY